MAWTKKESELAAALVADLRDRGWEIYQEVEARGSVADIVASQGRVLWAIETKLSLSLGVLGQANRWRRLANLVSVAVPPARSSVGRDFAIAAAEAFGIGVLQVWDPERRIDRYREAGAHEVIKPRFQRRTSPILRAALREEHKTWAPAGNAEGKRYTPFQATCAGVRRILDSDGPSTVRHVVSRLGGRHHYASEASARGSLLARAKDGIIEGVGVEYQGRGKPALLVRK